MLYYFCKFPCVYNYFKIKSKRNKCRRNKYLRHHFLIALQHFNINYALKLFTFTLCWFYQSAQATITKHQRLSGLNNRHFSQFWRLGSSRSRCWVDLVAGKSSFPGLQVTVFQLRLCPYMAESNQAVVFLPLLIGTLILSWEPYPHDLI